MIPKTMKALQLNAYDGKLQLVEMPVPQPQAGEVLVKIAATPVNPSDLMFIQGLYGFRKKLPTVPGFEGSGTVVMAGSGLVPRLWLGRQVSCAAAEQGSWAEYMVTQATLCFPLNRSLTLEQGASAFVNPWTAWALIDRARQEHHPAILHTAAASALGQMMVRLGQRQGVKIVNIVRRQEQVDLLHGLGADRVLSTHEPDFDAKLKEICKAWDIHLAFDAISGEMPNRLLNSMPKKSRVVIYGGLSLLGCTINPAHFIFREQKLEGFWLTDWMRARNLLGLLAIGNTIQKLIATDLQTHIQARVSLEDAIVGLEEYQANMTKGKVLILPNGK